MHLHLPYLRFSFDHASVFEQLLESSIRGVDPLFCAAPTGEEPESIDDLLPITLRASEGRFTLSIFGAASHTPYPMSFYEPEVGDIYVFAKGTCLSLQPCCIRADEVYALHPERHSVVDAPLRFLLYYDTDLFMSVNNAAFAASEEALSATALSIVRPKPVHRKVLN